MSIFTSKLSAVEWLKKLQCHIRKPNGLQDFSELLSNRQESSVIKQVAADSQSVSKIYLILLFIAKRLIYTEDRNRYRE